VGSSGTGKTTFAMQFIMHGIDEGQQGLYVSLEETPEQIVHEGELMGFKMQEQLDKNLFFIHLKGKNFKKMIEEQLPALVKARADYDIKTRVVIDPMTPVIWATPDRLEQRELIGRLFYTLKELGVVVATVEEHSRPGETIGEDVLLPIYLSDGALHVEYYPVGGAFNRTLKVIKIRGAHHGEGVYPYFFARGAGVIIRASAGEMPAAGGSADHTAMFDRALRTAQERHAPPFVLAKIEGMRKSWDYAYSPQEALQIMFDTYGIK
jgi:KaiC/GvpD/RAD55 family RecA-like ATPase